MRSRFGGLRVAYVPLSPDFKHPGDCRRFSRWAAARGIPVEIADPTEDYDLVVISQGADLSVWCEYSRPRAKVVYDFTDSYLAVSRRDPTGMLRGLAKFVTRQSRYLRLDHWKAIEDMCRRSDAVVCVTEEQKDDISRHCKNVHIVLDIHNMYVGAKKSYRSGDVFNLVWEGYPENVQAFYQLRDALREIDAKQPLALHLVTRWEFGRYMGKYLKRRTSDIARDILPRSYIYEWNDQLCSPIIEACDMALLPIDLDTPLTKGKPENKLLIFWRMGMPTLVSASPALERTMQRAELPMSCRNARDWRETLNRYVFDEAARADAGRRGKEFAEANFSEEKLLGQWDGVFESVLAGTPGQTKSGARA